MTKFITDVSASYHSCKSPNGRRGVRSRSCDLSLYYSSQDTGIQTPLLGKPNQNRFVSNAQFGLMQKRTVNSNVHYECPPNHFQIKHTSSAHQTTHHKNFPLLTVGNDFFIL